MDEYFFRYFIAMFFGGFSACVLLLLMVFASIALGHMTKHKIGFSILFYVLLYHLVGNIPMIAAFFLLIDSTNADFDTIFWIYGVVALLISPAFYFVTLHVMKSKLNLE